MTPVNGFLCQNLVIFGSSFWVHISTMFLALFGLFNKLFCRDEGDENSDKKNSTCLAVSSPLKPKAEFDEAKSDFIDFNDTEHDDEAETSKFFLKFKFQTYKEFSISDKGNFDFVPSTSTSKYEFQV